MTTSPSASPNDPQPSTSSLKREASQLPTKRPLSGVFAIDKPSGPTSMSLLEELKPLFAASSLFLNADGSLPENRRPSGKNARRGGRGGGTWNRNAGKKGQPLPPKIGQGGTLDPLASGVLVIGVGEGTKKLQSYLDGAKDYLTVGLLGTSTTSYDALDPILYRSPHSHVTPASLISHLPTFRGSILQTPPLYSAVRIDGMRLFEYARQGKELPRPIEKRKVEVKQLQLNSWHPSGSHTWKEPEREVPDEEKALVGRVRQLAGEAASADADAATAGEASTSAEDAPKSEGEPAAFGLTMSVGGGTYVRSIVHDLAREAGSAAHVVVLRRTRQGPFFTDRWLRPRSSGTDEDSPDKDGWAEKEELLQDPAGSSPDVEHIQGNCIPWSVFERAIRRMNGVDEAAEKDEATAKEGAQGPDTAESPAAKKLKGEDGQSVAIEDQGGLQEWERILLEQ
ncbi:hypothetical protein V8E36_000757 [Tilletia maclaganii]